MPIDRFDWINLNGSIKYQDNSIPKDWPIGYMFQEPRLMPWLTVRQNVTIVTQQTPEENKLSESLINEMGLNKYMNSFGPSLNQYAI